MPELTESGCLRQRAFTLVELLLVLAIMGILAAVVVPMTYRSLHGNQRRMAVRSVVGAAKYARSMAVLHQCPMGLRLTGGNLLVVDAAGRWGAETNAVAEAGELDAGFPDAGVLPGGVGAVPEELPVPDVTVRLERDLGKIRVVEWAIGDSELEPAEGDVRLAFDTNGRCTPFVMILQDQRGERVRVAVDHLGGAQTEVLP